MPRKYFQILVTWLLPMALVAPGVSARVHHARLAPAEGLMHVDVTYTEEANITDKTKSDNGAQEEDITNFRFRATAAFEQPVMMQPIAGSGLTFYPLENVRQTIGGGVSYNGETKRTGLDDEHRTTLEEKSQISFAGVLSDDSGSGVPDDNAAGIQFNIQSDMTGGCQGKRTMYSYGKEKKVQTAELNSCGNSDELHEAAVITREALNLDLRQKPDGKEIVHYAAQFHVTSCNLKPQYCVELKAAEANASANAGPNSEAMSDNWIGATTTGTMAAGFKIELAMFKELKVAGTWKRYLQMQASVTPVTRTRAAAEGRSQIDVEIADRPLSHAVALAAAW